MPNSSSIMSNVISLMPRRAQMQFASLRTVESYWDSLRKGRAVPNRSEINPRDMQSALEYAFILERVAPGVARFRLAGMHLTDLLGMDVRSMPLTAMFTPEARGGVSDAIERVFTGPEILTLTVEAERGIGRGALEGQVLLCPLKSDLGDVNRILGCFQTKGQLGRAPRRFTLKSLEAKDLKPSEQLTAQASTTYKAQKKLTRKLTQPAPDYLKLIVDNES